MQSFPSSLPLSDCSIHDFTTNLILSVKLNFLILNRQFVSLLQHRQEQEVMETSVNGTCHLDVPVFYVRPPTRHVSRKGQKWRFKLTESWVDVDEYFFSSSLLFFFFSFHR